MMTDYFLSTYKMLKSYRSDRKTYKGHPRLPWESFAFFIAVGVWFAILGEWYACLGVVFFTWTVLREWKSRTILYYALRALDNVKRREKAFKPHQQIIFNLELQRLLKNEDYIGAQELKELAAKENINLTP